MKRLLLTTTILAGAFAFSAPAVAQVAPPSQFSADAVAVQQILDDADRNDISVHQEAAEAAAYSSVFIRNGDDNTITVRQDNPQGPTGGATSLIELRSSNNAADPDNNLISVTQVDSNGSLSDILLTGDSDNNDIGVNQDASPDAESHIELANSDRNFIRVTQSDADRSISNIDIDNGDDNTVRVTQREQDSTSDVDIFSSNINTVAVTQDGTGDNLSFARIDGGSSNIVTHRQYSGSDSIHTELNGNPTGNVVTVTQGNP